MNPMMILQDILAAIFAPRRYRAFPLALCLALLLNTVIASTVYAATEPAFSKGTTFALSLLLLVVLGLVVYLFVAIFQPERF
jgi:K+-transporting ATPase KdpF subunit